MTDSPRVTKMFYSLCEWAELSPPKIRPALPGEPCDFTSPEEVRLNCKAATCSDEHHARHVFAHWLCDVHAFANERKDRAKLCNAVADVIARALEGVVGFPTEDEEKRGSSRNGKAEEVKRRR